MCIGQTRNRSIDRKSDMTVTRDRGWAWVICGCCFLQMIVVDGLMYSFSVIFIELTQYFGTSRSYIAWIGSIQISMMHVMGMAAGRCVQQYGYRPVGFGGAVLTSACFALSCLATQPWHLFITIGVGVGTGFCFMTFGFLLAVQGWFDKKVSKAYGFATTGSGIGCFAFVPLIELFIKHVGWQGAFLVTAGIAAQTIPVALLLRGGGSESDPDEAPDQEIEAPHGSVQGLRTDLAANGVRVQGMGDEKNSASVHNNSRDIEATDSLLQEHQKKKRHPTPQATFATSTFSVFAASVPKGLPDDNKSGPCKMIDFSLLRCVEFDIYLAGISLSLLTIYIPFTFLPDRAVTLGVSRTNAALLVSLMAAVNTLARIGYGFLADYTPRHRRKLYAGAVIVAGAASIASILCYNFWTLAVFACINAFACAALGSLSLVILRDTIGQERLPTGMALMYLAVGVSIIGIGPLMGWLFDVTGSYEATFIVNGILVLVGGVLILFLPNLGSLLSRLNKSCCGTGGSDLD